MLHSICQQNWKTQPHSSCGLGHRTGKGQFSFQPQRKAMPKKVQSTTQLLSSHTLAKWCSTFSKPGFNSTWTVKFQMFKLDLEKAKKPESKLPTSFGILKKQENSKKTSASASFTTWKPLTVQITTNYGKFFKRWEYQTTWSTSWEICMQVKKQVTTRHGTMDWFQIGKRIRQGCILSPCLSWEMLGWIKHKLESRLLGELSIISDM